MKKFFLIAAAAAMVLSSCSKNVVSEDTSDSNAINFGTYSGRSVTKAGTEFAKTTALPANTSFGVYAYAATADLTATSFLANFMKNVSVKYDGVSAIDTTSYKYIGTKYWPKANGIKLSFFAYYPVATATNGIVPSENGLGAFTFTAAPAVGSQVDFMVSDVKNDMIYDDTNKGIVDLLFHHTLCQVNVQTKLDQNVSGINVTVGSVQFNGVSTSGTFTPTYDPTTHKTKIDATDWSSVGTEKDIPFVIPTPVTVTADGWSTFGDGNTLLVVPQTLVAGSDLITVKYYINGIENTATVKLPADTTWEPGKKYSYNITIHLFYSSEDPESDKYKVQFTAGVVDWV